MAAIGRKTSVRDGAAAKAEKRKKIFVIAGSVFLLALLAFQIPRTMSRLRGPSAAAAPAPTTTTTPPGTTGAVVNSTGRSVSPRAQRRALARLKIHDPFAPAVKGVSATAAPAPTGAPSAPTAPASGAAASGATSKPGAKTTTAPTTTTPSGPIGFTAPGSAPAVPVVPPAAAIIYVNGKAQTVGLKQVFPLNAPAFRLVAVTRKTMKIRVAGGAFTGGRKAIVLERGKSVTLVNTTTGVRYVIRFGAPLAELPAPTTKAPATTAPAPTATAPTTTTSKTDTTK